jgi:hypothetical protein
VIVPATVISAACAVPAEERRPAATSIARKPVRNEDVFFTVQVVEAAAWRIGTTTDRFGETVPNTTFRRLEM